MRRFLVSLLSLALALSCLSLNAFAAAETGPSVSAHLELISCDYLNASYNETQQLRVSANSTFTAYIKVVSDSGYNNASYVATVSGTGFTMDGSGASRRGSYSEGDYIAVPIRVGNNVESGIHPVTITVQFTTGGETVTLTQELNVTVFGLTTPEIPETPDIKSDATLSITAVPDGPVGAGDTFEIGFSSYFNVGTAVGYSAPRGTVTVSGEGFSLAGALAEQDITSGRNYISVLADKSLTAGRHQLTVTVTYTYDGQNYTASRALNIDVESTEEEVDETNDKPSFKLASASIAEKKGRSNLATNLKLTFENTTNYTAQKVKVKIVGLGDLILNTYTDTVDCGDAAGHEKVNATFPIKFPEYPTVQTSVDVEVSFIADDAPISETFKVYLQAEEKEKEEEVAEKDTLEPKVIVSNFSVETDDGTGTIYSGNEFTVKVLLENTSAEKDLRNMTVKITPSSNYSSGSSGSGTGTGGPVFSLVDGTNSFYVDSFAKLSTMEFAVKFKCSASAGAGTYPIDIVFDYQYEKGEIFEPLKTDSLSINLPVQQPIKFDLMEWTPPTECGPDGTMISFQYFNKSKNPMTALGIGVEGDFTMETQYPGTLAASSYEYFQGTIVPVDPTAVGQTKTAILFFTFEDSAGVEQRIEEKFDVTITETSTMGGDMMGGDMMGGDMTGDMGWDIMTPEMGGDITYDEFGNPVSGDNVEEGGLPLWAKIAIPSAIGVIAVIVIVVVVKKVKAKRRSDDEDDDE